MRASAVRRNNNLSILFLLKIAVHLPSSTCFRPFWCCLPMTRLSLSVAWIHSVVVFVVLLFYIFIFYFLFCLHGPCVCVLCVKSVFWICSDKSIWRELYLLFVPIHSFISSSHWILLSNIQLNLQAVDQYQYAHMYSMLCIHFQWYFVLCVFFRSVLYPLVAPLQNWFSSFFTVFWWSICLESKNRFECTWT